MRREVVFGRGSRLVALVLGGLRSDLPQHLRLLADSGTTSAKWSSSGGLLVFSAAFSGVCVVRAVRFGRA